MTYQRVAALLKATTGINDESIGAAVMERAVRARLAASGVRDLEQYFAHVSSCALELQELIEAVVVPETWFFRDREAFVALTRIAGERRTAAQHRGILRVLSMPCSTGEEPFSIAMALLDADFSPQCFQIDGLDISARAVRHANQGVYGRNSFRGHDLGFRDRYFEPVAQGYRLSERVRESARLRHGNMFDMYSAAATYDAIFCRNVLIYFDRAEQQRVLQILVRLLAPDGVLFVGPSEAGLLLGHGFASARFPLAFAFRRDRTIRREPKSHLQGFKKKGAGLPVVHGNAPNASHAQPSPAHLVVAEPAAVAASGHWIETAQRLADEGNVAAALQQCEQHLNDADLSAAAFYLMGLLHDAAGRIQQAREYYRKALYLDPAHHEALLHLGTLLKGSGDDRGAQLLLERAQRKKAAEGK